jgi:hypothetical protein
VVNDKGIVRWRYDNRFNRSSFGLGNPFFKADFVLAGPDEKEELIIRRVSFIPSIFFMREPDGGILGEIRMRSVLRNKYTIDFKGGDSWTFRMPLFTTNFWGDSNEEAGVWVMVGPSKMEWNILVSPGIDDRLLVPAVAFVHHEWWNYS